MTSATGKSAQHLLDEVQTAPQLDALDVDVWADALRASLADGFAERDQQVRAALESIDRFAGKCMRIRLGDAPVPATFRSYLTSMLVSYDGDLDTLRARAAAAVGPTAAESVVEAASAALSDRARLRAAARALAPTPPEPEPEPGPPPTREELIELD